MVSRPQVFAIDVAISECCRDLFSFAHDVVTAERCRDLLSCLLMSRPLTDVATLISLQADVATACLFFINAWLPDLEILSRPARFAFNYSSVATGVLSSRP